MLLLERTRVGPADDGVGAADADVDGGVVGAGGGGGSHKVALLRGGSGDERHLGKFSADLGHDAQHGGHVAIDLRLTAAREDGDL